MSKPYKIIEKSKDGSARLMVRVLIGKQALTMVKQLEEKNPDKKYVIEYDGGQENVK